MNNKSTTTKKKRGGNDNQKLLDDNFIISNLTDILNQRPLKYKFNIKIRDKYKNKFYDIFIENEDEEVKIYNRDMTTVDHPCLTINFFEIDKGVNIYVYTINKCAPINNYGNFILSCLKEFANKYGYYAVLITSDGSTLELEFKYVDKHFSVDIDLAYLSILSTGESWYNRMGFYNSYNKQQIHDNILKINKKISYLDDSINIIEYINNTSKIFKENRIPICFKLINSYGKFREIYNFILEITKKTEDDTIQDVFNELNNYIKNNCDTNTKTCNVNYMIIQKISCFIDFVYNLLDLQYRATSLAYIVNNKQKAGKRKQLKTKRKYKRKYSKKKYNNIIDGR